MYNANILYQPFQVKTAKKEVNPDTYLQHFSDNEEMHYGALILHCCTAQVDFWAAELSLEGVI